MRRSREVMLYQLRQQLASTRRTLASNQAALAFLASKPANEATRGLIAKLHAYRVTLERELADLEATAVKVAATPMGTVIEV